MEQANEQFHQDSSAFFNWFTGANGTRLNPKLELADLRHSGAGRGCIAKADIADDEELFAIPRSLVLDTTNSDLQKQIDIPLSQFGSWNSLVLVIVYEYLRKTASPWYPYFTVLPATFDTPMFWTPAELAELKGSAVLDKIGKSEAEEGWKISIIPFMNAHPDQFPAAKAGEDINFIELAHMAGSLIMAYAFDIGRNDDTEEEEADEDGFVEDDEDDPAKGMVPFADMLNADADRNNARLFHEEDYLIMKATQPIAAGDEIFNDYGPLPRSDLLRMYGYVTENYAQYDVVELSLQPIYDVARETRNKHTKPDTTVPKLEDLNGVEEGYAISRPSDDAELHDAIPIDLLLLLSALAGDTEAAHSAAKISGLGKQRISLASAELLGATIRKRFADYETTISEDNLLLQRLSGDFSAQGASGAMPSRYRMAIQVRKGEKEILQHVLDLVQRYITSNTDGKRKRDADDDGPERKAKARE